MTVPTAIELRDIVKRFPGVVANDGVDLTVRTGTVHAIVGENGAGKSTLMKTLYGAHRPDEGSVVVNGKERHFRSPADAIEAGIGMVFQHFMLADNFTVWENIVLGSEPGSIGKIDVRGARKSIRMLAERYGLDVDADDLVGDLGVGDKQRVEILKVLYRGRGSSSSTSRPRCSCRTRSTSCSPPCATSPTTGRRSIFISHKLDEVLGHADAITVIRAGRTVGEVDDPDSVTSHQLAEMMVGSELPSPETREKTVRDDVLLEVRQLTIESGGPAPLEGPITPFGASQQNLETDAATPVLAATAHRPLDRVSFVVRAGEIVGVAGVEGNGQTELVEAIMGLRDASGLVLLEGDDLGGVSTLDRRLRGIGYIPEDRQRDGMVLSFPLWENVLLGHQGGPPFVKSGMLDRKEVRARTRAIVEEFDVRTPGIEVPAFTLSGGNQQKLIVGREMMSSPRVLVASHPTRGRRRRRPGGDLGHPARCPIARAGHVAHLGRPRGADRAVRPPAGDVARHRGRRARPVAGDTRRARVVHDGRRQRRAGDAGSGWRRERGVNRRIIGGILAPVLAAVVAIVVSSIALLIAGESPATAFREMWETIDSTQSVVLIVNRAVPYYVAGVAVAIGFKMNLFNIGAAGQYQLAALLAAGAGAAVSLWAPLHVLFVFVVAIVVGGAYAAIAGILKVWRGVNEVISTIMLNYIAIGISAFLLAEPLRNESSGNIAQTRALPASARLPNLNELVETFGFHLPDGVFLRGFLPFAILLGIGYWVLLNRSRFGFNLRVSGANAAAARTSGVNPKRMVLTTIILSGAVAGTIGLAPLMTEEFTYGDQFPKTLGFTGLALALLGRNHPVGIAAAALVWATIERATQRLSTIGIPQEIGVILQGSFLLAAVIAYEVVKRWSDAGEARAAAERTPDVPMAEAAVMTT